MSIPKEVVAPPPDEPAAESSYLSLSLRPAVRAVREFGTHVYEVGIAHRSRSTGKLEELDEIVSSSIHEGYQVLKNLTRAHPLSLAMMGVGCAVAIPSIRLGTRAAVRNAAIAAFSVGILGYSDNMPGPFAPWGTDAKAKNNSGKQLP